MGESGMKILHIATHMGDGAGKAISGLSIQGSRDGTHRHSIMLLDTPKKVNHIKRCLRAGLAVSDYDAGAMAGADIVVLNWWGGSAMERFIEAFPDTPCRIVVWSHINGLFRPLPARLVRNCAYLFATSPATLENTDFCEHSELVYGMGDFRPEDSPCKDDYTLKDGAFVIGCLGMPSWKRLPGDFFDYARRAIQLIPNCRFVMAGELSDDFKCALSASGMADYFTCLGWINDVDRLLTTFDIFSHLTGEETSVTTENSVLEALAVGLPVVASRKPIGKYLLSDGTSGFLTDSPEHYGEILLRLYSDESLRAKIGKAGRAHAIRTFRPDDNLNRFNTACEVVLQKPKTTHNFTSE
jgi:glycosyltransferase involved in cell wall biosynthesis